MDKLITSGFLCGAATKMMTEESCEDLLRKKHERNEACLNCKKYIACNEIAQYTECHNFEERKDEVWVVTKLG